ncbi:MAG: hypothetical protein AAGH92_07350 [Planctomycetota bacterium]
MVLTATANKRQQAIYDLTAARDGIEHGRMTAAEAMPRINRAIEQIDGNGHAQSTPAPSRRRTLVANMTRQQAEQHEQKNTVIGELRRIENDLAAIVRSSPNKHTTESLVSAYRMQTGGNLMGEISQAHDALPKLQRRFGSATGMAYMLLGLARNGQDWNF